MPRVALARSATHCVLQGCQLSWVGRELPAAWMAPTHASFHSAVLVGLLFPHKLPDNAKPP